MPFGGFVVFDGDGDGFAGSDEDDEFFGAGDGRIQQILLSAIMILEHNFL